MELEKASVKEEEGEGTEEELDLDLTGPVSEAVTEVHMNSAAVRFLSTLSHEDVELQHQGILLVQIMALQFPGLLAAHPTLALLLRLLWKAPGRIERLRREEQLTPAHQDESMIMVRLLVSYCKESRSVDVLFDLLSVSELILDHAL